MAVSRNEAVQIDSNMQYYSEVVLLSLRSGFGC